jgi:hypothetical protein
LCWERKASSRSPRQARPPSTLSEARPVRERFWNMPVLADDLLYLRGVEKVTCLKLRKGDE